MAAVGMMRKGERTRQKLMEAARLVFGRDGFLKAEVSEISRVAEKSNGAVYIYFENKSAILDALLDDFAARVQERLPYVRPEGFYTLLSFDDLQNTLRDLWQVYSEHVGTFSALAQAAMVDPHFSARYRESRQRAAEDIRGMIEGRRAAGFCQGLDPFYGTLCLESLLVNFMHEAQAAARQGAAAMDGERALAAMVRVFAAALELSPPNG